MRLSCFNCKYTNINRPADFTLADFWRVDKYPEFNDDIGNSTIQINSEKGEKLFNEAKEKAAIFRITIDDCLQPRLEKPVIKPADYDDFWNDYLTNGYEYCINRYGRESIKSKLIYTIKPVLQKLHSK